MKPGDYEVRLSPTLREVIRVGRCRSGGFTLMEVLVALVVMGVGVTLFISLFSRSMDLGRASEDQRVAASLAEEQMTALLQDPGRFDWPIKSALPGQLFEIGMPGDQPGSFHTFGASPAAGEKNYYDQFRWQAYGRLPQADSAYVEVTVVVRWTAANQSQTVALTSAAPRTSVAKVEAGETAS